MKLVRTYALLFCLVPLLLIAGRGAALSDSRTPASHVPEAGAPQDADKLVYADFETVKEGRPFSNRGGFVQLTAYSERPTLQSRFKALEGSNPPAPELVRLKKDDPNRAIAFDYEMQALNQYAGVGVEVHGQPDKDGKPVADDVSAYKFLSMQVYVTGVSAMRVEFVSRGQGMSISSAFPQMEFRVRPGFNTYQIPLKSVAQPSWAEVKVNVKDVLKKLTAVSLSVFCNECQPTKGTIVVDNLIFQN